MSDRLRLTTGAFYRVNAGSAGVTVQFDAVLESIEFEGPDYVGLVFDTGLCLWTGPDADTFEVEVLP